MADDGVTVIGADVAERAYQAIAEDVPKMGDVNRRIAGAGQQAARARAPRRTGALDTSIEARSTDHDATLTVGVPYWRAQEFGTRYVAGRRFMREGIDAMRTEAQRAYPEHVNDVIARHT